GGRLEHAVGRLAPVLGSLDELDAAEVSAGVFESSLAAAAGVNLGLEDDGAADLVERRQHLGDAGGDDAARDGRAGGGEQFLGLVFVNLHVGAFRKKRRLIVGTSSLLVPVNENAAAVGAAASGCYFTWRPITWRHPSRPPATRRAWWRWTPGPESA